MSFIHLHVHSTHSPYDGYSTVEEYFQKAEELGMPGLAITDHGEISGIPEMIDSAKKHPSVKPVFGCEFYLTDHYPHDKRGTAYTKTFHVILIAKNETGFSNLLKLYELSREGRTYGTRPRISHDLLERYHEGLICTTACIGGEIPQLILDRQFEAADKALTWYRQLFGKDFYLEVSEHKSDIPDFGLDLLEKQRAVNDALFKTGARQGIRVVATNDVHFLDREDGPDQDAMMCKKMHREPEDKDRIRFTQQEFFKTETEMAGIFSDHKEALENTLLLLNSIENGDLSHYRELYIASVEGIKEARVQRRKKWESDSILSRMDRIVTTVIEKDHCNRTRFREEKLNDVKEDLNAVSRVLGISSMQAFLFSAMCDFTGFHYSDINEFAKHLEITTLKAFSYSSDYEALRKKWLIRMSPEGRFRIPRMVFDSLRKNEAYEKPSFENMGTVSIIFQLEDFIDYVNQKEYSIEEVVDDAEQAMNENPMAGISRVYKQYGICDMHIAEKYLFFLLAVARLTDNEESYSIISFRKAFDDNEYFYLRNRISGGCTKLQRNNVIEFESSDGMVTKDRIKLKENVIVEICEDAPELLEETSSAAGVIYPESIRTKELFFPDSVRTNLDTLANLLEENHYNELKRSLRDNGMREGFTCLFYGAPGTGKTESAYQLAKQSGRELLEVDVASLMNCYVGETEKNTRRVFENYRRSVRGNKKAPIFLFNEADAILGKRMRGAEKAVDRMGNSMQNIILQEMEKMDGIMIATTNLSENLDPAFERRFLYKVKFENPTAELRRKIWKEMMPDLPNEEIDILSSRFAFSGGQIENISRKRSITAILYGKAVSFDQILGYCSEELLQNKERTRIGF